MFLEKKKKIALQFHIGVCCAGSFRKRFIKREPLNHPLGEYHTATQCKKTFFLTLTYVGISCMAEYKLSFCIAGKIPNRLQENKPLRFQVQNTSQEPFKNQEEGNNGDKQPL